MSDITFKVEKNQECECMSRPHQHETHEHAHGAVDPSVFATQRGIRAVQWSSLVMFLTAMIQAVVVWQSGSVALLADTIHNFGDAATAIPLWIAFRLGSLPPSKRFTYGYGRLEDLAGLIIVCLIFSSAVLAIWQSIERLLHPQVISHLWIVMIASLIGFCGNELAARFRIKVGEEIGSAALVADGRHARIDALTSISVLFGAIGVMLGFPISDPVIGLIISVVIIKILLESGKSVFRRLLDGVDPEVSDEIRQSAMSVDRVQEVTEVRVRWIGHRMHAELNVAVNPDISVEEAHEIAKQIHHQLLHDLTYLSSANIHIDPLTASGEDHHRIASHEHGEFPSHSH
jgi:cation diffusion facilitator family transporter